MSVTAFPVLARIISERRMLKRPLGALALSAAAVDDVSAWFLIALATAVAGAGSGVVVLETIGWAAVFCLGMAFLVRPLLARAAVAYDEAGRVPGRWITLIFAGVLLSAVATDDDRDRGDLRRVRDGRGDAAPRGAERRRHPPRGGLRADAAAAAVLRLHRPAHERRPAGARATLILITLALSAIAIVGKYGGTLLASRVIRLPWRESAVLGALMNTRGLTELIVLNLALSMGVISSALFTALVIMALVTTLHGRAADPRCSIRTTASARQPEEELAAIEAPGALAAGAPPSTRSWSRRRARRRSTSCWRWPSRSARSEPRRELILTGLVRPPRGASMHGGLQTEARLVSAASEQLQQRRGELIERGLDARAVAFTSADPGHDLVRLCRNEEIDLLLLDGRRPLLGDGIPREEVATVLSEARCDVAVLVAREGVQVAPGPQRPVIVPFGGADHDWAALELAAWIASASGAPLRLLGAAGRREDGRDAGGLLANASLVVQQFAGVSAEPVLAEPGREGILAATDGAGLLLVGLSERWRKEGLGDTRRAIARSAPAPIVFVRRGERAGALAPATELTRFGWSTAAMGKPA